jgi:hypothetical protein
MVGGVAGFKQQNSFCGLPLRLSPAELAAGVRGGWVEPYAVACDPGRLDPFEGADEKKGGRGGGEPATAAECAPSAATPSTTPAWRADIVKGKAYAVPLTHAATARVPLDGGALIAAAVSPPPPPPSSDPAAAASAAADARCAAAFLDLHARGYALTPGGNFGADWLAYPADPALYHAQLAVRAGAGPGDRLDPTLLAAAARGAHAARKHLVLAVVPDDAEEEGAGGGQAGGRRRVFYLTLAPEASFGS